MEKTIEGTIERVTFENPSTGFRVLKVSTAEGLIPVVGAFPEMPVGARIRANGRWEVDKRFGPQLIASSVIEIAQNTLDGLARYLASGSIKGIGAKTAQRIVATFGLDAMKVLDETPERLEEVAGMGKKRRRMVADAWAAQKGVREIMVFLQAHGATPALAARIHKKYGTDAANVVSREPFRLAREVWGIGFHTADRIAQGIGIAKDAPQRLQAGLLQAMNDAVDQGHSFLPPGDLVRDASKLLGLSDMALIEHALTGLVLSGDLIKEAGAIFRPDLHESEIRIARILASLTSTKTLPEPEKAIERFETQTGQKLAAEQRECVTSAAERRLLVVTGGPGTGKTTVVRALLALFDASHMSVALAAPTGRAAKRITETTGREACTLHRLLEIDPKLGAFRRDSARPIEAHAVIIDEVSMVDLPMADALLSAIGKDTRLILVGDVDQLPSVGPGAFLRDVIASNVVPCVRLTHVFRQAEASLIVQNAHRVNAGREPETSAAGGDFFLIERDAERAKDTVLEIVTQRIPKSFSLDPMRDVQVLVPMHRGDSGASALNTALQNALNPGPKVELERGTRLLRLGDKVMQLRNDYEKDVFNGDLGVISSIDTEEETLTVRYDARDVPYEGSELDDLALAYACTVHKSQGSEYPAVVVVLLTNHFVMLSRNLLYTAITRGKRLVVVVGQRRALQVAVREDRRGERKSRLLDRLRELLSRR